MRVCFITELLRAQSLVRFLQTEGFTWLVRDVFDVLVTRYGLVHDVTDTERWTHSGSTHSRIFTTFKTSQSETE